MKYYVLRPKDRTILYRVDHNAGTAEKFDGERWVYSQTALETLGVGGGDFLTPVSEKEADKIMKEVLNGG